MFYTESYPIVLSSTIFHKCVFIHVERKGHNKKTEKGRVSRFQRAEAQNCDERHSVDQAEAHVPYIEVGIILHRSDSQ